MTRGTKLGPIYTGYKQTPSQANWYDVRKDDPEFKKEKQKKSAEQRVKKKEWWLEITKDDVCCDCGTTECLEHDHRDGEIKLFNVGDGISRYGRVKILEERSKCDIRCRKCHMKRHYG
jgi:hypothetical protein